MASPRTTRTTLATPGLCSSFGEEIPVNFRAAAAMTPLVPLSQRQIPCAAGGGGSPNQFEPRRIPAFPYHELSYSTLKELLSHINPFHEDAKEIADNIQSHHFRMAYDIAEDASAAVALSTELLFRNVKIIDKMLRHDRQEQEYGPRSGAQHTGFLTEATIESLLESRRLIVAELKRRPIREGSVQDEVNYGEEEENPAEGC